MSGAKRWPGWVFALAIYVLIAFAMHTGPWNDPTHRWTGDTGDPVVYLWFLGWFPHAIGHGINPLLTNYIGYPTGANLMWNTSLILPGLGFSWLTALTNSILTWNVLIVLEFAASAFTGYLAVNHFVRNGWAAFFAGLLYGFSPYMFAQTVHMNIAMAMWPPLVLICLDELLVRQRGRFWLWGLALGLLCTAQLLTGEELLASTAGFAILGTLILAIVYRKQLKERWRFAAKGIAVGGLTAAVLSALPLYIQVFGGQRIHGVIQAQDTYVTDLLNFLLPTIQWLGGNQLASVTSLFTGNASEWNGYIGLPLTAVLVYIVFRKWGDPEVRFFAIFGVAIAVFSMGPHLHVGGQYSPVPMPWFVFNNMPLAKNLLPGRFMLYAFLCASILLAKFLMIFWQGSSRSRVLAASAVALIALSWLPDPAVAFTAPSTVPVPQFFVARGDAVNIPSDSVALVAPFPYSLQTARPQFWQMIAGYKFRLAGGRALVPNTKPGTNDIVDPRTLGDAMINLEQGNAVPPQDTLDKMRADLALWHVGTVIVPSGVDGHDQLVQLLTAVLGSRPLRDQDVLVWWNVGSGAPALRP